MENKMILKYTIAWLGGPVIGILNGSIRQLCYAKYLGELRAHQLSTLTGIFLFGLYFWLLGRKLPIESAKQSWIIGLIWLGLTIGFEFIFGHFVMGNSWSRLFHDYNIFEGRVWSLALIFITVAPYLFYRLARK